MVLLLENNIYLTLVFYLLGIDINSKFYINKVDSYYCKTLKVKFASAILQLVSWEQSLYCCSPDEKKGIDIFQCKLNVTKTLAIFYEYLVVALVNIWQIPIVNAKIAYLNMTHG